MLQTAAAVVGLPVSQYAPHMQPVGNDQRTAQQKDLTPHQHLLMVAKSSTPHVMRIFEPCTMLHKSEPLHSLLLKNP